MFDGSRFIALVGSCNSNTFFEAGPELHLVVELDREQCLVRGGQLLRNLVRVALCGKGTETAAGADHRSCDCFMGLLHIAVDSNNHHAWTLAVFVKLEHWVCMLVLSLTLRAVVKIFTNDALVANADYRSHVTALALDALVLHELLTRPLYFLDLSCSLNILLLCLTSGLRPLDLSDRDFRLVNE